LAWDTVKIFHWLGLIAVVTVISAPANAVTFTGFTDGCFAAIGCTNFTSPVQDGKGLTFTGSTFSGVNAGSSFSLGSFSTTTMPTTDYSESFDLKATFTAPGPTGSTTFDLDVSGILSGHRDDTTGFYVISLDTPVSEIFGNYKVSISLRCGEESDCVVSHGEEDDSSSVKAYGVITPIPEPSTWAMMILGFFGVGFMAYRRKRTGPALRLV
jgi:PEP-CTERM motif